MRDEQKQTEKESGSARNIDTTAGAAGDGTRDGIGKRGMGRKGGVRKAPPR